MLSDSRPRFAPLSRACLATAALLLAVSLRAQSTVTSTSKSSSVDEPLTLSPFEVNTDRDVGYTASNSLAGGRLNTDLRDTAAAISVFTKDFSTTSASPTSTRRSSSA